MELISSPGRSANSAVRQGVVTQDGNRRKQNGLGLKEKLFTKTSSNVLGVLMKASEGALTRVVVADPAVDKNKLIGQIQ